MSPNKIPPRPPFDSLPLDKDGPGGNAWGLYGPDDELGALNMLTPEVVASAASEIKTGERVSLDWQLNKPSRPNFGRKNFEWEMRNMSGVSVNDDLLHFNTQSSTQWDGFRHFGYQGAKRYYGGRSQEDLEKTGVLGIDAWVEKGGIVGRGVLLDYVSFCQRHSITVDPLTSAPITLDQIKQLVQEQAVTFRPGDILFIRGGFTQAYNALDEAGQVTLGQRPTSEYLGVESTPAMLRWIWDNGFAAVAGDMVTFEQAPVGISWSGKDVDEAKKDGGLLHQVLLSGWGVPIGEMFDLDALSETCRRLNRWTFFVSSVPLKVPGGVASPPNAVAIF